MKAPLIVALTGGIGSGKSAAAHHFAALGAGVIDTDAIAHALTAPGGKALQALFKAFGQEVFSASGALNRAALRALVFADAEKRHQLELILHPLIYEEVLAAIEQKASRYPYLLLVVPLLLERGACYRPLIQRIAVVDCPEELQIARVKARSGLSHEMIIQILRAQASRSERLAIADDVLINDGTLQQLYAQVEALHVAYLRQCATQAQRDGDDPI